MTGGSNIGLYIMIYIEQNSHDYWFSILDVLKLILDLQLILIGLVIK
jgi:hypothetical protein